MIRYKNIFLVAICIVVVAAVSIIANVNRSKKTINSNASTLSYSYKTNNITKTKSRNLNINNLNFSLNENTNNLNKIAFNSEESIYGLKSIYSLATIPHKIIKAKKSINNINKIIKKNNNKNKNDIASIRKTVINTEIISFSNYVRNSRKSYTYSINFMNIVQNYNNDASNKLLRGSNSKKSESVIGIVVGTVAVVGITIGIFLAWHISQCMDKNEELNHKREINRLTTESNMRANKEKAEYINYIRVESQEQKLLLKDAEEVINYGLDH